MTPRAALLREVRLVLDKHLTHANALELVLAADAVVDLVEAKVRQARQEAAR